jgi:CubicO group peptidase (beta-lactamase class C family)
VIRAAFLLAAASLFCSSPVLAKGVTSGPIPAALEANRFEGFAMVASKDSVLWQSPPRNGDDLRWPWASVSKQVLAILTMQQVDAGRIKLDAPADTYLPALRGTTAAPTVRQLLQHRSGLRNSDDTPIDAGGMPEFYTSGETGLGWCVKGRSQPGGNWRYNNCDSIVLGAVLESVTGKTVPALFQTGIAKPLGLRGAGYAGQGAKRLPPFATALPAGYEASLARFGAAGGLTGTATDLLKIDRALLAGKLVSQAAKAEMWAGDPQLGFMGLAQWSFEAPLKGCAKPVRIVERRGAIGTYQVRNIILPEADRIVILFTADGKLDFGEIWQGKGLSHDLLSAAACA